MVLNQPALPTAFLRLFVSLSYQYIFSGMCLLIPGILQCTPPYNLNRFPQTINSRIITNLHAITDFQIHTANLSAVTSAAILVVQTAVIRWHCSQSTGLLSQIVSFAMLCKSLTERLCLSFVWRRDWNLEETLMCAFRHPQQSRLELCSSRLLRR